MIILPIRTESAIRRTPYVNYLLIALNTVSFLLFSGPLAGRTMNAFQDDFLAFQSDEPALHQFFTYQFLHADLGHLFGNLLFLWVFGNSVNGKMGQGPYLLFYLAGGVFAAWGHAMIEPEVFRLVGASGAIAAVTTAYLALFPRSHVTLLVWFFFFLHFFELPAMLVIGLKIVVWDNIVAPRFSAAANVAHAAHLSGYFFGFIGALGMLLVRAVPRDQFDILSLWKRWRQRREYAASAADPAARFGAVARAAPVDPREREAEELRLDRIAELKTRITEAIDRGEPLVAVEEFERLMALEPGQCLGERSQLEVGRQLYAMGRFAQAAAAFDRFLVCYPNSSQAGDVRLLLGIIYARDLRQYEMADQHLTNSMGALRDEGRRAQCFQWLADVRAALGRPAPDR